MFRSTKYISYTERQCKTDLFFSNIRSQPYPVFTKYILGFPYLLRKRKNIQKPCKEPGPEGKFLSLQDPVSFAF